MAFKATLGTGESRSFHTFEEADNWFRSHFFNPDGKKHGKKTEFSQTVRQPDNTMKTEKIGSIEEVD